MSVLAQICYVVGHIDDCMVYVSCHSQHYACPHETLKAEELYCFVRELLPVPVCTGTAVLYGRNIQALFLMSHVLVPVHVFVIHVILPAVKYYITIT